MRQGYEALSDKEKQTLRLLLAGHDAKSMARHLGLSVHTVNERLRDARRKLSATSSKEAARLLREAEAASPDPLGDKAFGDAASPPPDLPPGHPAAASSVKRHAVWAIGGLAMISLAVAFLALSSPQAAPDRAAPNAANAAAPAAAQAGAAQASAAQAARQWLELVDAGKWNESWAATAESFRALNTVANWESASQSARVPLGRVLKRSIVSAETIPAPPHGLHLIRFKTNFAAKAGATETVSLAREGGGWRVAGYLID